MATRRYGITKGESFTQVTEAVGAATAADNIELTVDFGASPTLTKADVLQALEILEGYIVNGIWPPA